MCIRDRVVGKGCTEPFDVIELEGNSKDAKLPDARSGSRAGIHAEIKALSEAGELANGGTLYTTLEPCNHHGRTGPCTDAIIKSGVKRVVVAIIDPDEKVSGTGIEALRSADINVDVGAGSFEANRQLAPYLHHRSTGRPYVILKLAATLDGRIAAPDGSSNWITGEKARTDAHKLRAESDAICVGAGTVRIDNPRLTVRSVDGDKVINVFEGDYEVKIFQTIKPFFGFSI